MAGQPVGTPARVALTSVAPTSRMATGAREAASSVAGEPASKWPMSSNEQPLRLNTAGSLRGMEKWSRADQVVAVGTQSSPLCLAGLAATESRVAAGTSRKLTRVCPSPPLTQSKADPESAPLMGSSVRLES